MNLVEISPVGRGNHGRTRMLTIRRSRRICYGRIFIKGLEFKRCPFSNSEDKQRVLRGTNIYILRRSPAHRPATYPETRPPPKRGVLSGASCGRVSGVSETRSWRSEERRV